MTEYLLCNGYEKELPKIELKADKLYPTKFLLRLARLPKAKCKYYCETTL